MNMPYAYAHERGSVDLMASGSTLSALSLTVVNVNKNVNKRSGARARTTRKVVFFPMGHQR